MAADSLGFFEAARRVPEATEAAILAAQDAAMPDVDEVSAVVIVVDGAAQWSAEVVAAVAATTAAIPVVVPAHGVMPAFVGPSTLVVTIRASDRRPSLEVRGVEIPLGIDVPHARAALGALCAAPLVVLERLGVITGIDRDLDHAVAQLHHRRDALFVVDTAAVKADDARHLARRIDRLFPLVYGDGAVGALAATRWKQQCNVNAKAPAFAGALPDIAHDEIAGWGQHGDVTRQVLCGILLRHDHETGGAEARFATLGEVLEESLAAVHEVRAAGGGMLAQLLDLAYFGDAVSLHLAAQEDLDPGPAPALDLLAVPGA